MDTQEKHVFSKVSNIALLYGLGLEREPIKAIPPPKNRVFIHTEDFLDFRAVQVDIYLVETVHELGISHDFPWGNFGQ